MSATMPPVVAIQARPTSERERAFLFCNWVIAYLGQEGLPVTEETMRPGVFALERTYAGHRRPSGTSRLISVRPDSLFYDKVVAAVPDVANVVTVSVDTTLALVEADRQDTLRETYQPACPADPYGIEVPDPPPPSRGDELDLE